MNHETGQVSVDRELLHEALGDLPIALMIFRSVRAAEGHITDFEWLYTNEAATRLISRSDAYLKGRRLLEVSPHNREAGLFERIVQVVETGQSGSHEFCYVVAGQSKWFTNWCSRFGDGFVVTFTEVTEARALRQKSAHQASILKGMYEQSPFAACVVDARSGVYEFTNDAFDELIGKDHLVGTPLRQDYPNAVAGADIVDILEHVRNTGHLYSVAEYQLPSGRGGVKHYRIMARPLDAEERADSIQLVAVDVSELVGSRLRAEELAWQLAEGEELYRATFDGAPVGIAHVGLDGKLILANLRLAELLGYGQDELLEMTFSDLLVSNHPQEATGEGPLGQRFTISSKPVRRVDERMLCKDGSALWAALTVSLLRGRQGEPKHYVAIVEDVSDLVEANERLEQSHRHKDQFMAMLGHELRNPLAAIRRATELLSTIDTQDDHVLVSVRDTLQRQSSQMQRLIDDLLDVGRISRGKIQLERSTYDLVELLRAAVFDLEMGADESPDIIWDLPKASACVSGDRARLFQVFQNLVKNALKYTPVEGRIFIELRLSSQKAHVIVRDTGVGIEPAFLDKLFQPFEQAPQDISRAQGGLGLGLSLSAQIVELHDGTIRASSEGRGRGAQFVVELPLAPCDSPPQPVVPSSSPPPPSAILLVEDNRDAAELLCLLLESRGHEVDHATSGNEALRLLEDRDFQVMICDLGLPQMNGYELARLVRERAAGQKKPFLIALSGYGRPEDKERADEAGFDAHLTKPAEIEAIERLISAASRKE